LKTAGQRTRSLAEFVDIYPTLVELCGLPLPSHLEGTSLAPVLRDPSKSVKTAAFSQYPRESGTTKLMGYSMRTDRYRFTRWVGRADHSKVDAIELYDHQADPQENVNVASDPKNAELVARLTEQWLKGWRGAAQVATP
jgi:arylsulfatase A-like enzyme